MRNFVHLVLEQLEDRTLLSGITLVGTPSPTTATLGTAVSSTSPAAAVTVANDSTGAIVSPNGNPTLEAGPSQVVPYGEPVTFTFTATGAPGTGNPVGTVQFYLNGSNVPFGTGSMLSQDGRSTTWIYRTTVASNPYLPQLPGGTDTIEAVFTPARGGALTSATTTEFVVDGQPVNGMWREFDFNSGYSNVGVTAPGFFGALGINSLASNGEGWTTFPSIINTGLSGGMAPSLLYQDIVYGYGATPKTFEFAANPSTTYSIRLDIGDPRAVYGNLSVLVHAYDSVDTSLGVTQTVTTTAGHFNDFVISGLSGPSGIIKVDFSASPSSFEWAIAGIDIWDQKYSVSGPNPPTQLPIITVTSPTTNVLTNQNITITGNVTDALYGVASLQEAVDSTAGPFTPVSLTNGAFSFPTTLKTDGSADGPHTIYLQATDKAGNVSGFVDVFFTLDTIAPIVTITSPTTALTTSTNVTITGQATDQGSGVAQVEEQIDGGAFTPVSFDASGNFSFTSDLPLDGSADGQHTVDVQATDKAGNVSAPASYSFVLVPSGTTLFEATRFVTVFQQTYTVPSQPAELQFTYDNLNRTTTGEFDNGAFEASLTDANGNSLVLPIGSSQDAFLNISEGQAPVVSPNVELNNGTVDVDLSHITPGTQATLTVRLIDNNSDTESAVHISYPQIIAATMNTPAAATPAVAPAVPSENIDLSALSDVTTSMTAVYGETSLDQQSNVLLVGMAVKNTGTFPVDAPLVAVISGLSDPSIRVRNSDGLTPAGLPYFDLSGFIGSGTLAPGQSTTTRTLAFYDPNGIQFNYNLQILGQLNQLPKFTSQAITQAFAGAPYVYQATAGDPDGDPLTFSLLSGPKGMMVNATTGQVTYSPTAGDLGNQAVALQVSDGRGGTAEQDYTLAVTADPPNLPPVFTSTPVVDGNVLTPYTYQATATDQDGDSLTFSVVTGPQGLTIDPASGQVTWTPTAAELGTNNVTLQVDDGHGGTATQVYSVLVGQQPGNLPPVIVSQPVTTAILGQTYQYPVQAVDADGDPLTYSLTQAPPGMTINPGSGLVTWSLPPAASSTGTPAPTTAGTADTVAPANAVTTSASTDTATAGNAGTNGPALVVTAGDPITADNDPTTSDVLSEEAAHGFTLSVSTNSAVALPTTPSQFIWVLTNTGNDSTTYDISVSGLPANVTASYSPTITLLSEQELGPSAQELPHTGVDISLTETGDSLFPTSFTVTVTPEGAPDIAQSVQGTLTVRPMFVDVTQVAVSPMVATPGTPVDVVAHLLNSINQQQQAEASYTITNPAGTVIFTSKTVPLTLNVVSLWSSVDLGSFPTTGLADGVYTATVNITDTSGNPLRGGTNQGTVLVGTAVSATLTTAPTTLPAGNGMVTSSLQVNAISGAANSATVTVPTNDGVSIVPNSFNIAPTTITPNNNGTESLTWDFSALPPGKLYVTDNAGIATVDPATGTVTPLFATGFGLESGLTFDNKGDIIFSKSDQEIDLYNPATNTDTPIATVVGYPQYETLDPGGNSVLISAAAKNTGDYEIERISLTTGAVSALLTAATFMTGAASQLPWKKWHLHSPRQHLRKFCRLFRNC